MSPIRHSGFRSNLQILAHRTGRVPRIAQVLRLLVRRTAAAIGIGLDHTGIDGKAFAPNQAFLHAPLNHTLKHMPKRFALTEAAMPVLRETSNDPAPCPR